MAESRMIQECIAELKSLLGVDRIITTASELKRRSHDLSYHEHHAPHAVIVVESEHHVCLVLKTCNKYKVPVIAVAGATSLEGHTIPTITHGAIILDLTSMDKVMDVHAEDLDCVVQPGVGWVDLKEHLEPLGLFFPPDPGAAACVGGMCGTNCSGTFAWRYGTMKDNVLSLRVALPDGTVVTTRRRATKSSAGYDLTRLFVGSEGTLGVITQATLRLRRIPKFTAVVMAQFQTLKHAGDAVAKVVHDGLILNRMELMDAHTIQSINISITDPAKQYRQFPTILFECAGSSQSTITEQFAALKEITGPVEASSPKGCVGFHAASSESESELLWHLRKRAYFAAKDLRKDDKLTSHSMSILTTDVAVPISHIVETLTLSRQDLDHHGLTGSIVAHAGDGNLHVFLVIDATNPKEVADAQAFRDRNARMALQFGGTCSGEHGIGIGKIHLLSEEVGVEAIELMRKIKSVVDPNGIMNPGKVFELKSNL
ncbi:hypothetical protein BDV3_002504 [Batrachochytrium dendrobatidis]